MLFHEKNIWTLYEILPNPVNTQFSGYLLTVPYWSESVKVEKNLNNVCNMPIGTAGFQTIEIIAIRFRQGLTVWTFLFPSDRHYFEIFIIVHQHFHERFLTHGLADGFRICRWAKLVTSPRKNNLHKLWPQVHLRINNIEKTCCKAQ